MTTFDVAQLSPSRVRKATIVQPLSCPICGAYSPGPIPPHGWEEPCPIKVKESEAYLASQEVVRLSQLRSGLNANEAAENLRKMMKLIGNTLGELEEEDDDAA